MLTILSFFPIPPLAAGASAVNGILYMAADHDVFMGIVCLGGGVSMGAGRFAAYALGSGKYLALGQVANQIQIYARRITAGLGFVQGGRSSWDQANWIAEQEDASVLDYLGLIFTIGGTELSAYFFGAGALWPEAASGKQVPQKNINPFESDGDVEVFYRTMSQADYDYLRMTGELPATGETFISPTKLFSSNYDGVTVRFEVNKGTTGELLKIGVSNNSIQAINDYGILPQVGKGWGVNNAFFKGEGQQTNIGLGKGKALEIFNSNILNFNFVGGN